ncbi:MAG: transposase [Gammaproteobacteria bacterium]|nr:MAG: transposase [Gammaproteobacteria bacterium]
MPLVKRVLSIRIAGKERKQKVRKLILDLVHFKNLLILLIRRYRELYGYYPLNESLLYGLLAKEYKGKYQCEFNELLQNIKNDKKLTEFLENLKDQKEKVENPHLVQSVIRNIVRDFNNYFKSLDKYREKPKRFRAKPKPPKPKKLRYLIDFSVEGNANIFKVETDKFLCKLRNGRWLKVKLPKNFGYKITSFRLKLLADDLYVDVVYKYPLEIKEPKGNFKAGIDLGLDELLAIVSDNPNLKSFIVSGKELKAFNQWFSKEKAKLQSEIDKLKNELKKKGEDLTEKQIKAIRKQIRDLEIKLKILSAHRRRRLNNDLHKIARKVVDLLYETGHKAIYIGINALESKNGINLGKKLNQEFVSIPFRKLIELIKYKAKEFGMEVKEVDEAYTSKTSPFADVLKNQKLGKKLKKEIEKLERLKREDNQEKIAKVEKKIGKLTKEIKKKLLGKRKGNIFRDFISGKIFHSDLVGALNILRVGAKLLRLSFYGNLKVLFVKLCNPRRFKLMEFFYKVSPESVKWIGGSRHALERARMNGERAFTIA